MIFQRITYFIDPEDTFEQIITRLKDATDDDKIVEGVFATYIRRERAWNVTIEDRHGSWTSVRVPYANRRILAEGIQRIHIARQYANKFEPQIDLTTPLEDDD